MDTMLPVASVGLRGKVSLAVMSLTDKHGALDLFCVAWVNPVRAQSNNYQNRNCGALDQDIGRQQRPLPLKWFTASHDPQLRRSKL